MALAALTTNEPHCPFQSLMLELLAGKTPSDTILVELIRMTINFGEALPLTVITKIISHRKQIPQKTLHESLQVVRGRLLRALELETDLFLNYAQAAVAIVKELDARGGLKVIITP